MVTPERLAGPFARPDRTRTARRRLGVLLCTLLLAVGCGEEPPRLAKGEPPPPFTLAVLGGGSMTIPTDLQGQVVAIRFWADWCPFCEGEMRALEPIAQAYRARGLRIVAVNVRQSPQVAAAFIARLGVSYTVLLDADGAVARAYGVSGLPTTFILDRQGRLAVRILGEASPAVFEQALQGLL